MIREAIEWLLFPANGTVGGLARRMGYTAEQVGLMARHRRHRRAWAAHLDASRQAIAAVAAEVAGEIGNGGRCVVLGSGALYDVPLDDLVDRFAEVVLVDIAHPRAAHRAAQSAVTGEAGVRLVRADLTGIAAALAKLGPAEPLPVPRPFALSALGVEVPVDLTISVNLLSQLPIVPLGRARKARLADEETLEVYGRRIVEAHLEGLRALPGRRVLLSDIERLVYDPAREAPGSGNGVGRVSALFDADLPPPDRQWWWEIAPKGEMNRSYAVANRVGAWLDF